MTPNLLDLAVTAFVTFFVIFDPVGTSPVFAAMTQNETSAYRRRLALRGVLIAALILFTFAFLGEWLLGTLGISLGALRIAGGILLFLVAIDMLFAHETPLSRTTDVERDEAIRRRDISVFPLAIPLIAGPGAMTTVVLLMGRAEGHPMAQATVLGVMFAVLIVVLGALIAAARIVRLLGVTGSNVVTRVLGLILAALAVQFVVDGLQAAMAGMGRA